MNRVQISDFAMRAISGCGFVFNCSLSATFPALIALQSSVANAQNTSPGASVSGAAAPAPAAPTNVNANLNVSPKRIVFDRLGRSATVYVFNQGSGTATFDILLVDRVMLPDGQIVSVSEVSTKPELKPYIDKLKSASAMLITSPRRATLGPGKGQTIRVRVVPPSSGGPGTTTANGEYRTHLTITTIPPRDIGLTADQAASGDPRALSFRINTVFGISIPVILRVGENDFRGSIANPKIVRQTVSVDGTSPPRATSVLTFDIERLGPNSLFGNFEVRGARDKSSSPPLGSARGVGIYPEIGRRQVRILLSRAPLPGEKIEITFKDDDTEPGRLIAKAQFDIT